MFKRISEFLKPKKIEPEITLVEPGNLPEWLDTEKTSCLTLRSEYFNRSRAIISKTREDILQLLKDFGVEGTEHSLHPKVEQVNRLNLPKFKKRIESALDVTFSEDDEAYYRQVAEMVDGCFKAYRGPGRYLHHIYADEIKLFRQLMDTIGKELNSLTEAIKKSRIRLQHIEEVSEAFNTYLRTSDESASIQTMREEIRQKAEDFDSMLEKTTEERDTIARGKEYTEYSSIQSELEEQERITVERFEVLDAHIRTAMPVWRKAVRIAVDEKNRDGEKRLEGLINLAISQSYTGASFLPALSETATLIFKGVGEEKIPLKNSFEKSLFHSQDLYLKEISEAITAWLESVSLCGTRKDLLASHPAAHRLSRIEEKIADIRRDIRHLEEEEAKVMARLHHTEREHIDAAKIIRDTMEELTEGKVTVSGFMKHSSEDS